MNNKPIAIYTEKCFDSERCETSYFYKKVLRENDGDQKELIEMIDNRRKLIQEEQQDAKKRGDVLIIEYYNAATLTSLRYTTTESIIEKELEIVTMNEPEEEGE